MTNSQSAKPHLVDVKSQDGKYRFVQQADGGCFAERYGEPWLDRDTMVGLKGIKMFLLFVFELDGARRAEAVLRKEVEELRELLKKSTPDHAARTAKTDEVLAQATRLLRGEE